MSYRIGLGYDFHPFETGRKLMLGGVQIAHASGLAGHSDGDVLLHAVADALLGAAGFSDIGNYFPNTDPQYAGLSSLLILEKAYRLIRGKGFGVVNVDVMVIAEEPKIHPYTSAIKANLERVLFLKPDRISIKATTMEGKGTIGRREGIAVQAVALLVELEPR
ncbi:MAG: 2-C-methyl-D-erythritol 2,4-cyclodiphosphate synthase [Acidobacteria bacterium]|nr:2-C-methyl-D-erythritol 2,4-cyclodiphosphate synthase [Acidobacteriota bacterium]